MGFRTGNYASVWEVKPVSEAFVKARINTSAKNRSTGEYEQDFSGWVAFIGSATAKKAAKLKPKDRIKLGDVDVTYKYDKEKKQGFTDFKVFSFELASEATNTPAKRTVEPEEVNEPEEVESDDGNLPF